ncbi:Protein serine/threonine phosphatase (fragment) [Syntrophaceticus schinkii]|jgi:serine/threonine protein phosphatase PrpC|uniref:Protein serine/threonine phosphatase n=2 Tax=Syntrophaceticus schinkii TaxID=499207 RepID=A0A0B7MKQ1_9FIRM
MVYEPADEETTQTAGCIFAVADGIGGRAAGEVASLIAVRELQKNYYQIVQNTSPVEALRLAVLKAHNNIIEEVACDSNLSGMGSTLTVAAVVGERIS